MQVRFNVTLLLKITLTYGQMRSMRFLCLLELGASREVRTTVVLGEFYRSDSQVQVPADSEVYLVEWLNCGAKEEGFLSTNRGD